MKRENLLLYLKNILELERHKYETEQLLNYFQQNQYSHKPIIAESIPKPTYHSVTANSIGFGILFLLLAFFLTISSKTMSDFFYNYTSFYDIYGIYIWVAIGIIAGITFSLYSNHRKYKSYIDKLKQSEQVASSTNEKNLIYINDKNNIFSKVSSELRTTNYNTIHTLEEAYSLNIIHPKYRNIVAISSIYEYLDTGRCNSLEGATGAYATFELEVRLDKIINKLDIIISQLEQIKSNQFMLYNALQESNQQINTLSNRISQQTEQLNQIAVNTSITNYRLKVIEDNQFYKRTIDTILLV